MGSIPVVPIVATAGAVLVVVFVVLLVGLACKKNQRNKSPGHQEKSKKSPKQKVAGSAADATVDTAGSVAAHADPAQIPQFAEHVCGQTPRDAPTSNQQLAGLV